MYKRSKMTQNQSVLGIQLNKQQLTSPLQKTIAIGNWTFRLCEFALDVLHPRCFAPARIQRFLLIQLKLKHHCTSGRNVLGAKQPGANC